MEFDKKDTLLQKQKIPQLMQGEVENQSYPVSIKETEPEIKTFS